jgi:hypothetical protein
MSERKQDQAPQELADEQLDDVTGAADGIGRLISVTQMKSNDANDVPPPPPPPPPPRRIR